MEIYLYCTYEHSTRGFCATALTPAGLSLPCLPEEINTFFFYDRFSLLWKEDRAKDSTPFHPLSDGGFFGMRGVTGENLQGRRFVVNFALKAAEEELSRLRRIALSILADVSSFSSTLINFFSVGGPYSYTVNVPAFFALFNGYAECSSFRLLKKDPRLDKLLPHLLRTEDPKTERDLLRLAVRTDDRDAIAGLFGGGILWKLKHPCILTPERYREVFFQKDPLWSLSRPE